MNNLDVYHKWLGIPPDQQPPTLYRLLGLVDFESDADVIRSSAERQAMHVRRLSRGEFIDAGQELLNEIALAKLQLIDTEKRLAYDQVLRQSLPDLDETSPPTMPPTMRSTVVQEDFPTELRSEQTDVRVRKQARVVATSIHLETTGSDTDGSWLLGYHPDCDVRIEHETVSGMHCRVTQSETAWHVVDLKSTNGTFINGKKIIKREFGPTDLLVLGGDHRVIIRSSQLDPNSIATSVAFLGRSTGNELRIDLPQVSRFHARIMIDGKNITVDDLNSARGTYVVRQNEKPIRITRCAVRPDDVVRFADVDIKVSVLVNFITG